MVDRQVFVGGSCWVPCFSSPPGCGGPAGERISAHRGECRLEQGLAAAIRGLMAERRFKYTWSRTWPDKAEDHACHRQCGKRRSRLPHQLRQHGQLVRTMNGLVGNWSGSSSGQVADRDEACWLVEAA